MAGLSRTFLLTITDYVEVRTPECTHSGLGSSHFARRYFGNRCFFLFLSLLRCFSSGGSPSYVMDWRMSTWSLSMWVSPFRNLRIKGYLLLPEAYRSLSRLSSALSARASTPRSLKLNQTSHSAGTELDSRRIALRPLVHGFYLIHTFVCFLFSDVLIKFLSKLISLISLQYAVFKVRSIAEFLQRMEMERFELLTPCLQGRCSPN